MYLSSKIRLITSSLCEFVSLKALKDYPNVRMCTLLPEKSSKAARENARFQIFQLNNYLSNSSETGSLEYEISNCGFRLKIIEPKAIPKFYSSSMLNSSIALIESDEIKPEELGFQPAVLVSRYFVFNNIFQGDVIDRYLPGQYYYEKTDRGIFTEFTLKDNRSTKILDYWKIVDSTKSTKNLIPGNIYLVGKSSYKIYLGEYSAEFSNKTSNYLSEIPGVVGWNAKLSEVNPQGNAGKMGKLFIEVFPMSDPLDISHIKSVGIMNLLKRDATPYSTPTFLVREEVRGINLGSVFSEQEIQSAFSIIQNNLLKDPQQLTHRLEYDYMLLFPDFLRNNPEAVKVICENALLPPLFRNKTNVASAPPLTREEFLEKTWLSLENVLSTLISKEYFMSFINTTYND